MRYNDSTMSLLVVYAVFILISAVVVQAGSVMLAGSILRTKKINFKMGMTVAFLWLVGSGFYFAIMILIHNPIMTLFAWLAYLLGSIYVLKKVLGVKFPQALLMSVVAWIVGALCALVLAIPVRTLFVQAFKIPSSSMESTLMKGDRILVNKLQYCFREPRRWEVAIFRWPSDPGHMFLCRVVGFPGELIEIRNGSILINGSPVQIPSLLSQIQWRNRGEYGQPGKPVQIPKDSYFVLGDNSNSSRDSRYLGFVHRRDFIGQVFCIYWPWERFHRVE